MTEKLEKLNKVKADIEAGTLTLIFDHLGVAVVVEHAVELQRQQPLDA